MARCYVKPRPANVPTGTDALVATQRRGNHFPSGIQHQQRRDLSFEHFPFAVRGEFDINQIGAAECRRNLRNGRSYKVWGSAAGDVVARATRCAISADEVGSQRNIGRGQSQIGRGGWTRGNAGNDVEGRSRYRSQRVGYGDHGSGRRTSRRAVRAQYGEAATGTGNRDASARRYIT